MDGARACVERHKCGVAGRGLSGYDEMQQITFEGIEYHRYIDISMSAASYYDISAIAKLSSSKNDQESSIVDTASSVSESANHYFILVPLVQAKFCACKVSRKYFSDLFVTP